MFCEWLPGSRLLGRLCQCARLFRTIYLAMRAVLIELKKLSMAELSRSRATRQRFSQSGVKKEVGLLSCLQE